MKDQIRKLIEQLRLQLDIEQANLAYYRESKNTKYMDLCAGRVYVLIDVIKELERINEN